MSAGGDHTLGRWVRDRAAISPDRIAVEAAGAALSYRALEERAEALRGELRARGLRRGDRVATLSHNSVAQVVLFFACAKGGLVLTPLNPRLAAPELAYQLDDAEPALLLDDEEHAGLAAAALAAATRPVGRGRLGAGGIELAGAGAAGARAGEPARDEDPLLLVYTSGTTGRPKGALLTHANCFWTNLSLSRTSEIHADDVVLQVLPQHHVGGWNVQPLLAWWAGATVVLERRFDPGRALELVERRRVTTMMGVPATYLFMAQHPGFAQADLTSLRQAIVGGAPMPEPLLRTWQDRGVALVQGYGLTEAAPNVLCLPPERARDRIGWAGKPYPHVDVALGDPESGRPLDGPGRGELLVRGPNVFAGYWRNPAATAEALRGGWLHTGDVAERDAEGFYRICDRLKDVFISGGENVYPAEVESVLHEHPAVAEAAVIGVADPRWGEVGLAVVAPREGAAVGEQELLAHCTERLARYKVPRLVRLVDALPRSGTGKILKQELRARFAAPPAEEALR